MKKVFPIIVLVAFALGSYAQHLGQVTLSGGTDLTYFSFVIDQGVLIRVTPEGNVTEWGTEEASVRDKNYYSPKLRPYLGRVDYYGPQADSAYRGKIKTIGLSQLMYYGHYEGPEKTGKLKSIGRLNLDYFDRFADKVIIGKLKTIGNLNLEYYSSMNDQAFKGKLRSIGNTSILYHASYEDKNIKGKVKNIGPAAFGWYTSYDLNRYGLKSGAYRTDINGVIYILY